MRKLTEAFTTSRRWFKLIIQRFQVGRTNSDLHLEIKIEHDQVVVWLPDYICSQNPLMDGHNYSEHCWSLHLMESKLKWICFVWARIVGSIFLYLHLNTDLISDDYNIWYLNIMCGVSRQWPGNMTNHKNHHDHHENQGEVRFPPGLARSQVSESTNIKVENFNSFYSELLLLSKVRDNNNKISFFFHSNL